MYGITLQFDFEAAHRLQQHKGKCRNLHGHSYVAEVDIVSDGVNEQGMVLDFDDVKRALRGWVEEFWDHATILQSSDPLVESLKAIDSKVFLMETPPTAEHMARHLLEVANTYIRRLGATVVSVNINETRKCGASYIA